MLGLGLSYQAADISRADNKNMAEAAAALVRGLAELKTTFGLGSAFDEIALRMAFRFAGEVLTEDQITEILARPGEGESNAEEESDDPDAGTDGRDGLAGRNGHGGDSTAAPGEIGWMFTDCPPTWR
jgi:hypothetical protein